MVKKPTYEELEQRIQELKHLEYEHKQTKQRKTLITKILDTINKSEVWKDCIEKILSEIKQFTDFEAVAIRLREGEDFPYYVTKGFPAHFVEAERYLCTRDHKGEIERDLEGNPYVECMCGNVICGRIDASKDFFTEGGSFWSNNTSKLLSETTEKERQTRTRNRCNSEGYESVALFPLKVGHEILGLLQINDMRPHQFTDDKILLFEEIGICIGTAFSRNQAEEALKRAHDNLEMQVEERTAKLVKTNKALYESEVRFRTIYENAPVLISAFEKNGRFILWNKECEKVFGWTMEEINSHDNPLSLFYPDPSIQKTAIKSTTIESDTVFKEWYPLTKHGSKLITIWANFQLPDGAIINLGYDVTEYRLLEDQMIRSERLAATGQLAASIAHEINSPLQGIISHLELIKRTHNQDERLLENLNLVKSGFISIRDIVKKLLDLNRPGKEKKQPMNINNVIEDTMALLENYLKKTKVKIIPNLSSKVPNITASPQQLGQVFMNLINNAVEAMTGTSKSKDGWKSGEIADRAITINSNLKKNNIIIKVADTGPGISKDDLEHIFDPFYTRKKKMGMGIGLSICHGIIEDHNGTIAAISAPEGSTVFTITLPIK